MFFLDFFTRFYQSCCYFCFSIIFSFFYLFLCLLFVEINENKILPILRYLSENGRRIRQRKKPTCDLQSTLQFNSKSANDGYFNQNSLSFTP